MGGGTTLRLSAHPGGEVRILSPAGLDFSAIRKSFVVRTGTWLELIAWIDSCPERFGFGRSLHVGDTSLWSFARLRLIELLAMALPDAQALTEAIRRSAADRLVVERADATWAGISRAAAQSCGVPLELGGAAKAPGRWGQTAGRAAMHAARAGLALARMRRLGLPTGIDVLALGYSTWRRVSSRSGTRYIDPAFSPVLDEIARRGMPLRRLSVPTVNTWRFERTWVLHGDREAIPVELAWGTFVLGAAGRRARREAAAVRTAVSEASRRVRQAAVLWHGIDASPIVAPLVSDMLVRRLPRELERIRFFAGLLGRVRPRVLLLTSEYSGVALAASIAARQLGIPVVAVQHGVIWPGHPGYVAVPAALEWLARPDVVCVYGDYERRLLTGQGGFTPGQVAVTGAPRLDLVGDGQPRATVRARITDTLDLPPELPLVLFSSSGLSSLVAPRLAALLRDAARPVALIVKLHPIVDDDPGAYTAAAAGYPHLRVVREEFDLFDLLRAVDVHVSPNSTVLTEACAFDLPNLMMCHDLFVDTVGYQDRGVAVMAEPFGSMGAAVEAVLHGAAGEALRRGRQAFVAEHFHRLDQGASGRVADIVAGLMTKGGR